MAFRAFRGIALLLLAVPFNQALTIPPEASLDDTPAPFINITLPPSPRLNDLSIDCRGSLYGTGLGYDSCLDAFRTFKKGAARNPVQIRRGRGPGRAVQNLPWMWVSGDGRCTFNIVLKGRSDIETTTGADIARAAWMLVNECVRDQRGQGGAISGIGQHGNLGIILRTYDPFNVECVNEPQTYESGKCEALLDEVPADTAPHKTWGPPRQAGVDIDIPYRWQLGPPFDGCRMTIRGMNQQATDTMTLYDAWHAAAILAAMCARAGKPGSMDRLGAHQRLRVVIDDGRSPPS